MDQTKGKRFGYGRVSKTVQSEDRQLDLLTGHYGIPMEDVFIDKMTGARKDRPSFEKLQLVLRPNDTVVVESLSRLSRNLDSLLTLLKEWQEKGINLISHKESIDMSSATGRLMVHLLVALAEFERENLRERVREGLASARARGKVGGRPKTDDRKLEKAIRLYEAKSHSISEICQICAVTKSVLYRELKKRRETTESIPDET